MTMHRYDHYWQLMTRERRLASWACVYAAIAGCATAPATPEAVTTTPESGRAVVVGWGSTAGENARAALAPAQGARVTALHVFMANDKKISLGENIARLAPGEYNLTISCNLYIGYRLFTSDTVIHADLGAGRVYRLRAEPEGRRCHPSLEDVTDRQK